MRETFRREVAIALGQPQRLTFLVMLICSACASNSPAKLDRYEPPASGAPAVEIIDNQLHAGHLSLIDGTEAPSLSRSVRLTPGVHRVGIDCHFAQAPGIVHPLIKHVTLTGTFVDGRQNGDPRTWLADAPGELSLPAGFE